MNQPVQSRRSLLKAAVAASSSLALASVAGRALAAPAPKSGAASSPPAIPAYALWPTRYERGRGAPFTVSARFAPMPDVGGPYTLAVVVPPDVSPQGLTATVTLNGRRVVGPDDLRRAPTRIETTVELRGDNLIEITLRGRPGDALVVSIVGNAAAATMSGWRSMPGLSAARANAAVAQSGPHLYAIGGYNGSALASVDHAALAAGGLGAWSATSALLTGRFNAAACASRRHAYVVGGVDGGGRPLASVERASIDPRTGALGAFKADRALPTARSSAAAIVMAGHLYLVGGLEASGPVATVLRAAIGDDDGALGPWREVGRLRTARHSLAVVSPGGGSFLAIGGANGGELATVERVRLRTDGGVEAAEQTGRLNTTRRNLAVARFGTYVAVFGGAGGPPSGDMTLASWERAAIGQDGSIGGWEVGPSAMPHGRDWHGAAASGGSAYVVGGRLSPGDSPTASVDGFFS